LPRGFHQWKQQRVYQQHLGAAVVQNPGQLARLQADTGAKAPDRTLDTPDPKTLMDYLRQNVREQLGVCF